MLRPSMRMTEFQIVILPTYGTIGSLDAAPARLFSRREIAPAIRMAQGAQLRIRRNELPPPAARVPRLQTRIVAGTEVVAGWSDGDCLLLTLRQQVFPPPDQLPHQMATVPEEAMCRLTGDAREDPGEILQCQN